MTNENIKENQIKFYEFCEEIGFKDAKKAFEYLHAVTVIFIKMKAFVVDGVKLDANKLYHWTIALFKRQIPLIKIEEALLRVESLKWVPSFDDFLKNIVLNIDYNVEFCKMLKEDKERLNPKFNIINHNVFLYNVSINLYEKGYSCDTLNQLSLDKGIDLFRKSYDEVLLNIGDKGFVLKNLPINKFMITQEVKKEKSKEEIEQSKKAAEEFFKGFKELRRGVKCH